MPLRRRGPFPRRLGATLLVLVVAGGCGLADKVRSAVDEGRGAVAIGRAKSTVFAVEEALGPRLNAHVGAAVDQVYARRVTELRAPAAGATGATVPVTMVIEVDEELAGGLLSLSGRVGVTAAVTAVTVAVDLAMNWRDVAAGADGLVTSGGQTVSGVLVAAVAAGGARLEAVTGDLRVLGQVARDDDRYACDLTFAVSGGRVSRAGTVAGTGVAGEFAFTLNLDADGDGAGVAMAPGR